MTTKHDTETKPKAAAPPPPPIATRAAMTPEEMAASSVGAQVILDYNGSGSLGARGGAGATIEENTMARDAHLVALGLDPNAPSGPPTVPDPEGAVRAAGAPVGRATRISSLAAGIITGDPAPVTPPPPEGGGSAVPVNRDVPHASQAGASLSVTMGNWENEPTAYVYEWTVGSTVYPATDAATYAVQPADVGTTATCVVTATNAAGSTAAPPSNEVTISDPASSSRSKK